MSDENEIEKPSDDSGDDDESLEVPSDFVFHVDRAEKQVEHPIESGIKLFVVAYMSLLLVALTLRVFERRK